MEPDINFDDIINEHLSVVEQLKTQIHVIETIASQTCSQIIVGGKLLLAGNGGSAADCQHIAAELIGRFKKNRKSLPAIALTVDTSIITAVSNDYDFTTVFSRQLEGLAKPNDVLWLFSTSGNSSNIIEVAKAANNIGISVFGFTGESGGLLKGLCDTCLCVNHTQSDRIQECHIIAYHMICEYLEQSLTEQY